MMKKALSALLPLSLVCAQTFVLKPGWNLVGAAQDIQNLSAFDKAGCIEAMWKYDPLSPKQWSVHLPNPHFSIPQTIGTFDTILYGEGVWIYNSWTHNCIVESSVQSSTSSSANSSSSPEIEGNGIILQTESGHKILGATLQCLDNMQSYADMWDGKIDGVYPQDLQNCSTIEFFSGIVDDGDGKLDLFKDDVIVPVMGSDAPLDKGTISETSINTLYELQDLRKKLEKIEQLAEQNATTPIDPKDKEDLEKFAAKLILAAASIMEPSVNMDEMYNPLDYVSTLDQVQDILLQYNIEPFHNDIQKLALELNNAQNYDDVKKFIEELQKLLKNIIEIVPASSSSAASYSSQSSSSTPAQSSSISEATSSSAPASSSSSVSTCEYDPIVDGWLDENGNPCEPNPSNSSSTPAQSSSISEASNSSQCVIDNDMFGNPIYGPCSPSSEEANSSSSVPEEASSSSTSIQSSSNLSSISSNINSYDTVIELTQGNTSQTVAGMTLVGLAGEKLAFNKKDNLYGTPITFIIKVNGENVAAVTVPIDMTGEFEFTDVSGNTYVYTFEDAIKESTVNFTSPSSLDEESSSSSAPASSSSSISSESMEQESGGIE